MKIPQVGDVVRVANTHHQTGWSEDLRVVTVEPGDGGPIVDVCSDRNHYVTLLMSDGRTVTFTYFWIENFPLHWEVVG